MESIDKDMQILDQLIILLLFAIVAGFWVKE